jgi:hypothetical protein
MDPGRKRLSDVGEEGVERGFGETAAVIVINDVSTCAGRPQDGQNRLVSLMSPLHAGH